MTGKITLLVAVLMASDPLAIASGRTEIVELRAVFREATPVQSIRLGLFQQDVGVAQPGGALLAVRVEATPGSEFPFWTRPGGFTAASLAESYSNFPNPFVN